MLAISSIAIPSIRTTLSPTLPGAARFPCPTSALRRKTSGIRGRFGSAPATDRRRACGAASCRARGRDWAESRLRSVLQARSRDCSGTCVHSIAAAPEGAFEFEEGAVSLKRYPATKHADVEIKAACAALDAIEGTRPRMFNFEVDGRGRPSLHKSPTFLPTSWPGILPAPRLSGRS